jgi:exopolysaccharide production protein ExoQ
MRSNSLSAGASQADGYRAASHAATARWSLNDALRWLAPFVAVAVVAYPTLIWSLTEAQVVNVGPALAPPPPDGPPSMILRIYFPLLLLLGGATWLAKVQRLPVAAGGAWATSSGILHPALLFTALFLGFAAISHTWAVDPDLSLRRCVLVSFIIAAITTAVLATDDWRRLVNALFWWFSLVVVLNAYAVLTQPPTPLGHAGLYPHKNYLGAVSAMIIITALHQVFIGRSVARIVACFMVLACVVFLIVAKSKTSLALSLLAPVLAFGFAWLARTFRISPALSLPVLFGTIYFVYAFGAASGFWDFEAMATLIFGDPSLTQRTDIWAFAFRMMPDHLVAGFGYEGFWGAGPASPSIRAGGPGFISQMPHAHNGYIDLVLQTGFIGLGIVGCMMLAALHVAGRVARSSLALGSLTLSYMVFCLLYNLFETTYFRSFNVKHMMLTVAISLAVAFNARMTNAQRAASTIGPRS